MRFMITLSAGMFVFLMGPPAYPEEGGLPKQMMGQDGAPMVLVPPGEFTMGTRYLSSAERPAHRVYLDAYYMDKYEVTTSRYAKFLEATGRKKPFRWNEVNPLNDGERPVVGTDWDDADGYCRWAGKRLPTEAEWEKAARGTDGRIFPWGNAEPRSYPSRYANFAYGVVREWKGYSSLSPVGSYEVGKSPYSIYDMAGNVWEWVADWYDERYYRISPKHNPQGPSTGKSKVLRGGSWRQGLRQIIVAYRQPLAPVLKIVFGLNPPDDIGFRCARQP